MIMVLGIPCSAYMRSRRSNCASPVSRHWGHCGALFDAPLQLELRYRVIFVYLIPILHSEVVGQVKDLKRHRMLRDKVRGPLQHHHISTIYGLPLLPTVVEVRRERMNLRQCSNPTFDPRCDHHRAVLRRRQHQLWPAQRFEHTRSKQWRRHVVTF